MCGRYTQLYTWDELCRLMQLTCPALELGKRYNVAPSQKAPVIRRLIDEDGPRADLLHWGLIPSWAKDRKIGYSLINARAETISTKPAFRSAFKTKRCIVPISGFYEWKKEDGGKTKTPYYIHSPNDAPLMLAGLWESWSGPHAEPLLSFSIITTTSNDLLSPIHERMPVLLGTKEITTWLDPKSTPEELTPLLKPASASSLSPYQVSTLVNSPKNDDPRCIEKVR